MKIDVSNKLAGLLVPVFALRHEADLGIGDTTAMRNAIDFCAKHHIGVLQVLPINETGGDNSPYNAISSVALDPVLLAITPDTIPGLSEELYRSIASDEVVTQLRKGSVHYPRVKRLKQDLLEAAFKEFEKAESQQAKKELAAFEADNKAWLEHYTLFRALIDEHGGNSCWTHWESELQSFQSAKQTIATRPDAANIERTRRFWTYVQWLAYGQWRELKNYAQQNGVSLMGDLPFGVSRYSADVWGERNLFDMEWSCGAPPESFFQSDLFTQKWGQNWGMPLYKWSAHEKENFRWWRQRVQHLTELFHSYRIDHVLGFFRVYAFPWIPERNGEFTELTEEEAAELTEGVLPQFLPRPDEPEEYAEKNCAEGERILKVLMEAAGNSAIVAEDLGVVPDYVRPLLHKMGIAGFAIPIFERDEEDRSFKDKEDLAPLSLATYGTHDHQPLVTFYNNLVTWWHGPDGHEGWLEVQRLMRFLGIDENNPPTTFTDSLFKAFLTALLESPCWLAVLMITDLLATTQRFNEPGLSGDYNWSQRLDRALTDYDKDPVYAGKIKVFEQLIEETNRLPRVATGTTCGS